MSVELLIASAPHLSLVVLTQSVQMIFSILTAISQPLVVCSGVTLWRYA
jgi:hypothetical protein